MSTEHPTPPDESALVDALREIAHGFILRAYGQSGSRQIDPQVQRFLREEAQRSAGAKKQEGGV